MIRGGFAWLKAVQNMSGKGNESVKRSRAFPNIEAKLMSRRSPGKRESLDSLTTREISLTRRFRKTQRFSKMRNFAGLLKPVVCTKQVGRQVLLLLNNKRLVKE